ncbi:hypothetical protein FA95DRAFT_1558686, partial [Auriscalpium vulgare]
MASSPSLSTPGPSCAARCSTPHLPSPSCICITFHQTKPCTRATSGFCGLSSALLLSRRPYEFCAQALGGTPRREAAASAGGRRRRAARTAWCAWRHSSLAAALPASLYRRQPELHVDDRASLSSVASDRHGKSHIQQRALESTRARFHLLLALPLVVHKMLVPTAGGDISAHVQGTFGRTGHGLPAGHVAAARHSSSYCYFYFTFIVKS